MTMQTPPKSDDESVQQEESERETVLTEPEESQQNDPVEPPPTEIPQKPTSGPLESKVSHYLTDNAVRRESVSLGKDSCRREILKRRKMLEKRVWATQQQLKVKEEYEGERLGEILKRRKMLEKRVWATQQELKVQGEYEGERLGEILKRRKMLEKRVWATQQELKVQGEYEGERLGDTTEHTDELEDRPARKTLKSQRSRESIHDKTVSQYATVAGCSVSDEDGHSQGGRDSNGGIIH